MSDTLRTRTAQAAGRTSFHVRTCTAHVWLTDPEITEEWTQSPLYDRQTCPFLSRSRPLDLWPIETERLSAASRRSCTARAIWPSPTRCSPTTTSSTTPCRLVSQLAAKALCGGNPNCVPRPGVHYRVRNCRRRHRRCAPHGPRHTPRGVGASTGPSSGQDAHVDRNALLPMVGGRLVEHWPAVDQLGLLQQLNAIPTSVPA